MKPLIQRTEIRRSKIHGWGVFAKQNIKKGQVIESCLFLKTEKEYFKNSKNIRAYIFQYYGCHALVLGNGSLYNHHDPSNTKYITNKKMNKFIFIAKNDIKRGDEIFIPYGEEWWKRRKKKPILTKK